jgi:glyoxylase-like metal-dependent hydrolase (beta-lactamase superfamily II)
VSSVSGVHPFNLGSFRCLIVSDGERKLEDPYRSGFVNATDAEMRAEVEAYTAATGDPANQVGVNILLVDTGRNRVIVDTGNGPGGEGFGKLLSRLDAAGVSVAEIDTVIITHGHSDHINANTDGAGNSTFPRARYVINRTEWEHWTREPGEEATKQLLAIEDRFDKIDADVEIVPGIRAVSATGHTPGQMALLIESDDARLLHVADAWHHPVELLRPDWYFNFDWNPAQTIATRRRLLDLAAIQDLLVLPYHATFPGLGRVRVAGDAWRWEPVLSGHRQ